MKLSRKTGESTKSVEQSSRARPIQYISGSFSFSWGSVTGGMDCLVGFPMRVKGCSTRFQGQNCQPTWIKYRNHGLMTRLTRMARFVSFVLWGCASQFVVCAIKGEAAVKLISTSISVSGDLCVNHQQERRNVWLKNGAPSSSTPFMPINSHWSNWWNRVVTKPDREWPISAYISLFLLWQHGFETQTRHEQLYSERN